MKAKNLLAGVGLAALMGAPTVAQAQFPNQFNGFFAARPFMFRTMGVRPVMLSPLGNPFNNLIGTNALTVNPSFTGHLGASFNGFGPIATGFNSGIFPNGGVGLGFSNAVFPGAGTAMNPGFDPRFGNQFQMLNGQVPGNMAARLSNQSVLNPFIDPNGGFVNPSLQANGAINPFAAGNFSPNATLDPSGVFVTPGGAVVPGNAVNGLGTTIIDHGIGTPTVGANAPVNANLASDLVSARIENGRLVIRYTGDPTMVRSMTFSLLDASRRPLKVQIINSGPAEARMTLTSRTEFYRVNIEFMDGRSQVVEGRV